MHFSIRDDGFFPFRKKEKKAIYFTFPPTPPHIAF